MPTSFIPEEGGRISISAQSTTGIKKIFQSTYLSYPVTLDLSLDFSFRPAMLPPFLILIRFFPQKITGLRLSKRPLSMSFVLPAPYNRLVSLRIDRLCLCRKRPADG